MIKIIPPRPRMRSDPGWPHRRQQILDRLNTDCWPYRELYERIIPVGLGLQLREEMLEALGLMIDQDDGKR